MHLSDVLAHPDIARLTRALQEQPAKQIAIQPPNREAAIALVLRLGRDGDPELLMIKRAEVDRDPWSGHVACPGGRKEPADRDLQATVTRETWEETGIDLATEGRFLGALDDVMPRTPVLPPIVIRPFVAVVPTSVAIIPSLEVAAAFWVPLSALRERAAWGMRLVAVRGTEREEATFTHGDYVVWGLTERVLKQLLERIG